MKKRKYHIFYSWLLLICFVAGQYMIFAHQHNVAPTAVKSYKVANDQPKQTVKEKCDLCDVMHHNVMLAYYQVYFNPVNLTSDVFYPCYYNFTSIQLILAGGRAPPVGIS